MKKSHLYHVGHKLQYPIVPRDCFKLLEPSFFVKNTAYTFPKAGVLPDKKKVYTYPEYKSIEVHILFARDLYLRL